MKDMLGFKGYYLFVSYVFRVEEMVDLELSTE